MATASKTRAQPRSKRRPAAKPPTPRTARQNFNRNRKAIGRRARRLAGRRGKAFGVISLAIAATAFTVALTGAVSEVAAWEFGLATEGLGLCTAWIVGDLRKPADQSHIKRTAAAAKARATMCGEATNDGTPCERLGRCPHHKGGAKNSPAKPTGKASAQSGTKRSVNPPTVSPGQRRRKHLRSVP